MSRVKKLLPVLTALLILGGITTRADGQEQTTSYSGDLWTRSTVTGNWGGTRDWLEDRGITIKPRLTLFYQGLTGSVTRRERPENFAQALERKPDDIKVVIQFSEV